MNINFIYQKMEQPGGSGMGTNHENSHVSSQNNNGKYKSKNLWPNIYHKDLTNANELTELVQNMLNQM